MDMREGFTCQTIRLAGITLWTHATNCEEQFIVGKMQLRSAYAAFLVGGICGYTRAAPPLSSPSSSLFPNVNENITLPVNFTLSKPLQYVYISSPCFRRTTCSLTKQLQPSPTTRTILLHFRRRHNNILPLWCLSQQAQGHLMHLLRHRRCRRNTRG